MQFGGGSKDFLVNSPKGIAQCVQTALGLMKGEWFLDTSQGTDYLGKIIGYKSASSYDSEIQRVILGVDGVTSITSYSSTLSNRVLSVNATIATTFDGQANSAPSTTTVTIPITPTLTMIIVAITTF